MRLLTYFTKPTSALAKNATNVNAIVVVNHCSCKVKKSQQVGSKENNCATDISFIIHARTAGLQFYTHSDNPDDNTGIALAVHYPRNVGEAEKDH